MDNPRFKLAWHLVLNDFVDIKSKFSFGQTSKFCKQLIDESFKQTIHLRGIGIPTFKLAHSLILRCGRSLRTIELEGEAGRWFFNGEDIAIAQNLATQSPNLIELPTDSFEIYQA